MRSAIQAVALAVALACGAGAGVIATVLIADAMIRAETTTTVPCTPAESEVAW